jgi:hypothetical protein
MAGGALVVSAGGAMAGGATISGGTVTLSGAAGSGQTITFVGSGGELVLDNLPAFAAQIAGLVNASQKLDLAGFAYSSGETRAWSEAASNTSGTLTVTDGGQTAQLTLLGVYTTSNFILSDDGAGGTIVVDPPLPPPSTGVAGFAQAMAVIGGGSNAPAAGAFQGSASARGGQGEPMLFPTGTTSTGGR